MFLHLPWFFSLILVLERDASKQEFHRWSFPSHLLEMHLRNVWLIPCYKAQCFPEMPPCSAITWGLFFSVVSIQVVKHTLSLLWHKWKIWGWQCVQGWCQELVRLAESPQPSEGLPGWVTPRLFSTRGSGSFLYKVKASRGHHWRPMTT